MRRRRIRGRQRESENIREQSRRMRTGTRTGSRTRVLRDRVSGRWGLGAIVFECMYGERLKLFSSPDQVEARRGRRD